MGQSGLFRWGAVSITGNFRENNEDNFFIDSLGRLFLVADGMGGQSAGEKASEMAVEVLSERLISFPDSLRRSPTAICDIIVKSLRLANSEIIACGELNESCRNMGTTIVYAFPNGSNLYLGGIGDSRIYLLRDGRIEQLTEDHTLTQALVKAGTITAEDAKTHRYRNVLYRYLGTKEGNNAPGPIRFESRNKDRLIICSDGLYDGNSSETMLQILTKYDDPQQAAERLVESAQQGGSRDNITCIVLHRLPKPSEVSPA